MSNLNGAIQRSVSINFVGRYSNIAVQLVVTGILARLLNPHDFGVVAVLAVLVTFFSFISEMGLGPAIVQFRELQPSALSALFWMTVGVGSLLGLVFALSGPVIGSFYRETGYVSLAQYLAASIALSCWGIVPLALLRKAQQFRSIVVVEVASALLSGVIAIGAAYRGWGVAALATKSVSYATFMLTFCLIASRFNPFTRPDFRHIGNVLTYSGYQFAFNIVNYFTRNLDKLVIGKLMGGNLLGMYDMSYRLMLMPISNLTQIISPALQPIYAVHQSDRSTIFASYRQVVRILSIAGGFVGAACYLCSHEIILLAYGEKWIAAATLFSILSLSIPVQVVLSSSGAIFQAIGRTDLLSLSGLLSACCSVGAMIAGALSGSLVLFCWLLVGSFFINGIQAYIILIRYGFGETLRCFFRPSAGVLCGTALILAACVAAQCFIHPADFSIATLVGKIATLTILYIAVLIVTGDLLFLRRCLSLRNTSAEERESKLALNEGLPS